MSPIGGGLTGVPPGFPRVSGDEPLMVFAPPHVLMFSPRERG